MKNKHTSNTSLQSMKEFEKIYYPHKAVNNVHLSNTNYQDLAKELTKNTFISIKKKYGEG